MDRLQPRERSSGYLSVKRATGKLRTDDQQLSIVCREADKEQENGRARQKHIDRASNHYLPAAPAVFPACGSCVFCVKRLVHLPTPLGSSLAPDLDESPEKSASRVSCSPSRHCLSFSQDYTK